MTPEQLKTDGEVNLGIIQGAVQFGIDSVYGNDPTGISHAVNKATYRALFDKDLDNVFGKPSSKAVAFGRKGGYWGAAIIGGARGGIGLVGNGIRGFKSRSQTISAMNELKGILKGYGIRNSKVGIRGSAVTGKNSRTGAPFSKNSDIDVFVASDNFVGSATTSKNIPGFMHPDKVNKQFPEIEKWSDKWSGKTGHDVNVGGFKSGSDIPDAKFF